MPIVQHRLLLASVLLRLASILVCISLCTRAATAHGSEAKCAVGTGGGGTTPGLVAAETRTGTTNNGTEEEAVELFDVFEDINNVYGMVGTSEHVHYLGFQESTAACAFAAVHFYLSSGGSVRMSSFVWHPLEFARKEWQGLCFGRSSRHASWDGKLEKGVTSARLRPRRWRRWLTRLNPQQQSLLDDAAAALAAESSDGEEERAGEEGWWEDEQDVEDEQDLAAADAVTRNQANAALLRRVPVRGGGDGGARRVCNVLEWRLVGEYMFGDKERYVFTARSCSICGWKGCNLCPMQQVS
jgi:hypothetical protein